MSSWMNRSAPPGWWPDADTLDLAEFRGPTLVEDLQGRDFTINAMALDLATLLSGGALEIIDPLGGLPDLDVGLVRMVAADNLAYDPLRLLRAYRFAATHGFTITTDTAAAIQALAPALAEVAGERVHQELFQLLAAPRAAGVLRDMDRTGLLTQVFPELADMKGVPQDGYHHLNVFEHSLEAVAQLENVLAAPAPISGAGSGDYPAGVGAATDGAPQGGGPVPRRRQAPGAGAPGKPGPLHLLLP